MEFDFEGNGRFEIRRRLGAGGMGVVYEAFDRDRKQTVALKTLKRVDGTGLLRFKNEFRALHDIDHPNLVSLYELSDQDGHCFFTMELVHGVDFLSYVLGAGWAALPLEIDDTPTSPGRGPKPDDTASPRPTEPPAKPPYDEARLRSSLEQLVRAVAALHAAGKVHRDIKPPNILVTSEGRLVLLDFGLVTGTTKEGQSVDGNIVGTAAYMAPEQAALRQVGPAADWYSVGVLLYEALTTRLPHEGKNQLELLMNKQTVPVTPPSQRVANVPPDLDELCVALLRGDPESRPNADEIMRRLGVRAEPRATTSPPSINPAFSQTTPFVGRESELARLRTAFEDSKAESLVVVIEGESGLGKTELARQFTKLLSMEVPDAVILNGRCYERESVAYKAFDGIVDELSRHLARLPKEEAACYMPRRAGLLPRLFPVLLRVEEIAGAPRVATIPDAQAMRREMFGALRELLARLTDRHPVVLTIDDLQWTDADSLILLQEVLCDPAAPRLLVLATMRPMDEPDRERVMATTRSLEQRRIQLEPFSQELAEELAGVLLPSFDDQALAAIAREAAGHPLFVMELARDAEGPSARQGLTLEQTLWKRISALPDSLLGLLQILCIADARLTQAIAADAAEITLTELQKAAAGLRIAHLARTSGARSSDLIEPYHDRVREIVAEHLTDSERQHCHRRLSLALARAGSAKTAPQALVRHAAAAGDRERAAEYAETAARHATEAMAFDRAAEFFETALSLGEFDADRTRALRLALAEAYANAGRSAEAAEVFLIAATGADASTRLACQHRAAEQWLISGHIKRGLDALGDLLTEMGVAMPVTSGRALRSLLWTRLKLRLRGLRWRETSPGQIGPDTLSRIDMYNSVSHGLSMVDNIRGADFQSRGLLLSLRTGERFRVARALFTESVFMSTQGGGNLVRARKLIERAEQISKDDPYLRAWASIGRGAAAYFGADYQGCIDHIGDAENRLRELGGAIWELNSARLFYLWSFTRIGTLSTSTPLLEEYVRDATRRGDLYATTSLIRSCHIVWLARGDMPEAHRVLDQTSWAPLEGGYHLQHWFSLRARGELALYEGRPGGLLADSTANFAALQKSLLLRVITIRIDAHWLRARFAIAEALIADDPRGLLDEAARATRALEKENDVYASASALLLRAAIAAQRGDRGQAIEILTRAAAVAGDAGLFLHAETARRRQGELVGGADGRALIARADQWMSAEGIREPVRMVEVVAPGFPS